VTKKFPHSLFIRMALRKPFATIATAGRSILVDRDGVVLGEQTVQAALPILVFDVGDVGIGTAIREPLVEKSLALLRSVTGAVLVERITSVDGATLRVYSENTEIILTHDADIADKAATLQTLIGGFRIKGKLPAVIDLRFDKPVVRE